MTIEVWSDFLCPYCLLGKKRLEAALANLNIKDAEVEVKSFLLNPGTPETPGQSIREHLMEKYGMDAAQVRQNFDGINQSAQDIGFVFDFDSAKHAGTDKAHALLQYAKTLGLGGAFSDRLQQAAYQEGAVLDDEATLIALAQEIGIPQEEASKALADESYAAKARTEYRQSLQLGARGVPFFVIDGRYGLSGAQPIEVFEQTLAEAAGL